MSSLTRPSLSPRLKASRFEALARVGAGSSAAVEALAALFRRSHGARTIEAKVGGQNEANGGAALAARLNSSIIYVSDDVSGVVAEGLAEGLAEVSQAGHERARAPLSTLAARGLGAGKAMDNAAR